jgi:cobalt-zinc-cadmium efflux system protein
LSHIHTHNSNRTFTKEKRLGFSIVLNVLITIAQIFGGLYSGSLSLLSDAMHNFSDVISLIISYIASVLSGKKQTMQKTFGYKRAEIVAAFINTLVLIIVALLLVIEAIKRFNNPETISSIWVIVLAIIAIIFNGLSVVFLHGDAKNNMNIKSSYLHLLSDTLTSVAVLIAGILMYFFNLYWIDSLLTLLIAVYLIFISWSLLLESLNVLMLFTPPTITVETINQKICTIPEVQNLHHVHVWQLDNKQIHFEGHVDFIDNLSLQNVNIILDQIRNILHEQFKIDHVTLQPEYNICDKKDLISQGH